ncbi:MAG TPA: protein kinase [Sedimentisphaerales bacterium]|nr:protein kinase [Sedimentisphaerales bacterium]
MHLQGTAPDIEELVSKYPEFEHQIRQKVKEFHKVDSLFDSLVQAGETDFEDTETEPDLVGQKVGSFEIIEMIGRGGMGVVYLARDTKLDRSVAIKSIPPKLIGDSTTRTRFRREARLLASLNHPNIGAIHDIIEQDEGVDYLVLEYVPGQTLAQRIACEPLKLEEAFSIGQQIAEAVSVAHEKGVIHRDLKPGNIKITPEGKVKVLDFGLAKASGSQDKNQSTDITQPGRVIGTPAYMSPEQARGNQVDHRSDIWSFACILYEMLTGHSPFESDTATDTLARIIERQPNWQALPQQTPANIRVILRRCLEKDPRWRLQHIKDAAIEIRETLNLLAAGIEAPVRTRWPEKLLAGPGRIKSLAVLPLQNLTGDPEQEYFADGMTEALIANLGKIGALQVRSRTSIMQYKDVKKQLPEIARELNVDAVVEGSVMRVAEQVRITAQLIHAPTDTHLWVDSYERDLRDILTLLSEVARTIARQIEITVTPDQEARLAARRPVNPDMYVAYLKGMFHLNKMTPEGTKKGLDYLRQAIEKDPEYPLAYGGLALGYAASAHAPGAPPDAFTRAEAAALKALELDDTLVEAHAALAQIKLYRDWDWEAAGQALQLALKLNPSLTLTRAQYSYYLLLFGRTDEALAELRRVQEVDPLVPLWPAWQGWQYWWAGQYEEAINEARKSLELDSDFVVGLYVLGNAYAAKGMYEEAIKAHQRAGVLSRDWKSGLGLTYALAGRRDEARLVLAELEADSTTWDTWFMAQIYAVLGEKDEAFRWLEAAYGPPHHPYLPWISHPPAFKPLHDDSRFGDLLRRMNLPE